MASKMQYVECPKCTCETPMQERCGAGLPETATPTDGATYVVIDPKMGDALKYFGTAQMSEQDTADLHVREAREALRIDLHDPELQEDLTAALNYQKVVEEEAATQ